VSGLVLLDPVDAGATSSFPALRAMTVPTAILAVPYAGRSRYYRSDFENLCAPK
jgi:hypothetical protein